MDQPQRQLFPFLRCCLSPMLHTLGHLVQVRCSQNQQGARKTERTISVCKSLASLPKFFLLFVSFWENSPSEQPISGNLNWHQIPGFYQFLLKFSCISFMFANSLRTKKGDHTIVNTMKFISILCSKQNIILLLSRYQHTCISSCCWILKSKTLKE